MDEWISSDHCGRCCTDTLATRLAQWYINCLEPFKGHFLLITLSNDSHSQWSLCSSNLKSRRLLVGPQRYKLLHLVLLPPHIYSFISLFESCDHSCQQHPNSAVIVVCCCCPHWPPSGSSVLSSDQRRIKSSEILNKSMLTKTCLDQ